MKKGFFGIIIVVLFCLGVSPKVHAALFDWDLATNPTPGAVWQYNNITITVTPDADTSSIFDASVASTPSTGGNVSTPNILQFTNGDGTGTPDSIPGFTVTIDFTGYGPVQNATVSLYDVDQKNSAAAKAQDFISNIQATLNGGGTGSALSVTPPVGATYSVINSGATLTSVTGNSTNVNTTANGNLLLDFGSQSITKIQFTYKDLDTHSAKAGDIESLIAMADINFTPSISAAGAPEVGTWLAALTAIGLVLGSRRLALVQA